MNPLISNAPVLRSKRLRLRAPTPDDFPQSYAMWSDPVVTRFIGGRPHTKEEIWGRLLRYIGHWQAVGYGYWIVELADGGYIGEVGFSDYKRDLEPSLDGFPEMGWVLASNAHGQGFAFEASRAALEWRDAVLPSGQTFCFIAPEHMSSLRIAETLGFRRGSDAIYRGDTMAVLWRESPPAGELTERRL